MARTVDPNDPSEVDRQLREIFDRSLDGQIPRLLDVMMGPPEREGPEYVASRGEISVRVHTSYGSWTLSRPRLADKSGKNLASLALELARLIPGMPRAKSLDLYRAVNRVMSLGLDVDNLLEDARKFEAVHAVMPAPDHYLPVPSPDEIKALAEQGSNEFLVRLFNQAAAVYRYDNARGEFCYYKLRIEDRAADTKRFIRAAYTAHGGLRVEGPRLKILLGNRLPLYNVPELIKRPEAPVMVVEGEKTQAAAARRFPDFVVVSADSPTAPEDTDWNPLVQRDVYIFPDNDTPGIKYAHRVLGCIREAAALLLSPVSRDRPPVRTIVPIPSLNLRSGHDLADADPPDMVGWAEEALRMAQMPDAETARLNESFLFVNDLSDGEAYVLVRRPFDPRGIGRAFVRLSQREFHSHFVNDLRTIHVGKTTVEVPVSKIWMESPHRDTVRAVVCDPDPNYEPVPGVFNYWHGFNTRPEPGDFPTIRALLDALTPEPDVRRYVECFLASIFQRPHRVPLCALVIRGRQGVGKSLLAQVLELMVGHKHALRSTNPEIDVLGDFNGMIDGRVLVVFEELPSRTATRAEGKLKNLITSDTLMINEKNKPHRIVRNFSHVIITSNEDVVVKSGPDSRRFIYLTMTPNKSGEELRAFAEATVNKPDPQHSELRAFMHYLLHEVDLTGWDPTRTPATADQEINRAAAIDQDTELSWWMQKMEDGRVSNIPMFGRTLPALAFDRDYQDFCMNQRIQRPVGKLTFRKRLWVYLYGRGKPPGRAPRQRGSSPVFDLTNAQREALSLTESPVEAIYVPFRDTLLEVLHHETGVRMDLPPEDPQQPTLPDGRPDPDQVPF